MSEMYAIYQALLLIKTSNETNVIVFTDSLTSLQIISAKNPNTYKEVSYKIQLLLQELNLSKTVLLHWVRAHKGIIGNEIADFAAKKAHTNNRSENTKLSLPENMAILRNRIQKHWEDNWEYATVATGKRLFLRNLRDTPIRKDIIVFDVFARREQVLLHRLRIGHVGVQSYLSRFCITGSPLCNNMECMEEDTHETLEHYIFTCSAYEQQRANMFSRLAAVGISNPNLKILLCLSNNNRNLDIIRILLAYIYETERNNQL